MTGKSPITTSMVALLAVVACRPSEPPPSYNEDLGTEESVLLPTTSAWYDPAVAKGSADWRPFRKPGAEAKPSETAGGEAKAGGGNQAIESELRTLVSDFNTAVADGKFDEAADLLIEEQIAPAKQIVELIPVLLGKMKEVAEVLPGDNENLKKAVAEASLSAVLKLDVASITVSGPTEAVGKLASAPREAGDVRFAMVKETEGEYWYIDHPQIRAMAPTLPSLQQSLPHLDAFIADVKSGKVSAEALAQPIATLNQIIGSMRPPGSQPGADPTKDVPENDEKPGEGG